MTLQKTKYLIFFTFASSVFASAIQNSDLKIKTDNNILDKKLALEFIKLGYELRKGPKKSSFFKSTLLEEKNELTNEHVEEFRESDCDANLENSRERPTCSELIRESSLELQKLDYYTISETKGESLDKQEISHECFMCH